MRSCFTKITTPLCLALFLMVAMARGTAEADHPQDRQPNIVVIMADDLGYGDVSCYGAHRIATPNIDRLAERGLRFTSGYCSASTCTPTRYSFLTGEYAFRKKGTGIAPPNAPAIIPPGTPTIASLLSEAGYRTAVIGKWHLGLGGPDGPDWNGELKPGPLELGFDTCFLLPTTNDRVPQVYVRDHRVPNLDPADPLWVGNRRPSPDHPTGKTHRSTLKMNWSHGHNGTIHNGISRIGFYSGGQAARFRDEDLADRWVKEAIQFMRKEQGQPFFLFFASHDIHVPRMPHERFQGKSGLGFRGDAILELDWCVGQIVQAVDDMGQTDNTLIIFCSDNGPVLDDGYEDGGLARNSDHQPAGPFRGGKYSVYEGGTRTPLIAAWPGRISPGVSDQMICTIDFAASFAALLKRPLRESEFPDSFNVLEALLGTTGAKGRSHLVQQNNGNNGTWGLRQRDGTVDWKLHRTDSRKAYNVVVTRPLSSTEVPKFQLFDLTKDPSETNNVIDDHPEVAERLKSQLEHIIRAGSSR